MENSMNRWKYLAVLGLLVAGAAHAVPCEVKGVGASPNSLCGGSGGGTNYKLFLQLNGVSGTVAPPVNTASWGTTNAGIQAAFAANIYNDLAANTGIEAQFANMDDVMLARLSTELAMHDPSGYTPYILDEFARQLTAADLVRLASAFGTTAVGSAVTQAPSAVQAAYHASAVAPALPVSQALYLQGGGIRLTETGGSQGYDLLLVAYFQPGTASANAAMLTMVRYVQTTVPASPAVTVTQSGKAGLPKCGTVCTWITVFTTLDPNWRDQLGDALAWANNNLLPLPYPNGVPSNIPSIMYPNITQFPGYSPPPVTDPPPEAEPQPEDGNVGGDWFESGALYKLQ
jgi:hypothetical protein